MNLTKSMSILLNAPQAILKPIEIPVIGSDKDVYLHGLDTTPSKG
jgi:hypothetical protein